MSATYAITGTQTVASPTDTCLGLTSATTVRPEITFFVLGSIGTPADNALQWLIARYTAAGTATAVTPLAQDPGAPASLAAAGENHTAEPTYTAGGTVFNIGLAQRNTYPWYGDADPIMLPATAANGIGWQPVHASYTGDVVVSALFKQ